MIQTMQQHLRFIRKVKITDDCWQWLGWKNCDGYGGFSLEGKNKYVMAHRFSYTFFNGRIPTGMVLDHQCRNRACVNPSHLRAVTPLVNLLENSIGFAAVNANKKHCIHGHLLTGKNVAMETRKDGRVRRRCVACTRSRLTALKNPTHE